MSEEIWPGYGHWAIPGWADEGLRGAAVLTSLLRYGAALAMKCCSNAPHLRQAASHGRAEEVFFGIGCENM